MVVLLWIIALMVASAACIALINISRNIDLFVHQRDDFTGLCIRTAPHSKSGYEVYFRDHMPIVLSTLDGRGMETGRFYNISFSVFREYPVVEPTFLWDDDTTE